MKRILIVTPEIEGLSRNGGIGTAFTALAVKMAELGFYVDVLINRIDTSEDENLPFSHWVSHYKALNVNLRWFLVDNETHIDASDCRKRSFLVLTWLKEHDTYDIIIGCDWLGDLYYALLCKKQGLYFTKTRFIINTHGSTLWVDEGNYQLPNDQNHMEVYFIEQKVVEMADEVISPSQYLIHWMSSKGWDIPQNRKVILNLEPFKPATAIGRISQEILSNGAIELVFFGRLEVRRGLGLFLRAMANLKDSEQNNISKITFLGKISHFETHDVIKYIEMKLKPLNVPVNFINNYDRTQANDYLKKDNILAIIPSLIENSPYTVYECLVNNINFIASSVGGIPELISSKNHSELLFAPNHIDLYHKILYRLSTLNVKASLISTPSDIEKKWLQLLNESYQDNHIEINDQDNPLVSVCLVHHDRPHLLRQAIRSLQEQSYNNIEVILVDDGSCKVESHEYLRSIDESFSSQGWKIIKSANNYLGAARNLAVSHAKGEYLLFMDDDNVAKPNEIEVFVKAAKNSGADILTSMVECIFDEAYPVVSHKMTHFWLPLGASLEVGSFSNCFGDANAMVRTATFREIGGFTEDYGVGHEDWEFFAKACIAGYSLMVVPEPLFWYRVSETGMLRTGNKNKNNYRSYRPFMEKQASVRYAMGLIPGYLEKISSLEEKLHTQYRVLKKFFLKHKKKNIIRYKLFGITILKRSTQN